MNDTTTDTTHVTTDAPSEASSEGRVDHTMSAADLLAALTDLNRLVGPKAESSAAVRRTYDRHYAHITIWPRGMGAGGCEHLSDWNWPGVFAAAHAWAANATQSRREGIIKRMALAIIELTDECGECSEVRLAGRDFAREEIAEFHAAACQRAGEMAGKRPFVVWFG